MNRPPVHRLVVAALAGAALLGPTRAGAEDAPRPLPAPTVSTPPPKPKPLEFPNESVIERHPAEGPSGVVYFYRTNFIAPADLANSLKLLEVEKLGAALTPSGKNALLISGDPDAVALVLDAAAYFDVPAPQVFIEAKVVEITYESNFEFGLDYLWSRAQNGPDTLFRGAEAILSPPSAIASTLPGGLPFQGSSLLWGFVGTNAMKFGDLELQIQAMQLEGKAEVLSKPSLVVTQGVESSLSTEEHTPTPAFVNANNNNVSYNTFDVKTGVTLKVTADHVGESFVTLKVEPLVDGVAGLAASRGGTLQPITTKRSARTTVTMGDGECLVIGGLYSNAHITEKAKTPLISEIPLLGQLFTRTRETKAKTELVFLLTPRIVRKTADLRVITPPSELERLESEESGVDVPAGPHLPGAYRPEAPCEPCR